jgi:hypothetical protein
LALPLSSPNPAAYLPGFYDYFGFGPRAMKISRNLAPMI